MFHNIAIFTVFYRLLYFDQINAVLVSIRDFKVFNNILLTPHILIVVYANKENRKVILNLGENYGQVSMKAFFILVTSRN